MSRVSFDQKRSAVQRGAMRSRKRRAKVTQTPKPGHASDDVGRPSDAPSPIRPGESRRRVAVSANRCPLPNLATGHPRVRSVGPVFCATIASGVRRRAPSGSAPSPMSQFAVSASRPSVRNLRAACTGGLEGGAAGGALQRPGQGHGQRYGDAGHSDIARRSVPDADLDDAAN